jgi:chorismate mutase
MEGGESQMPKTKAELEIEGLEIENESRRVGVDKKKAELKALNNSVEASARIKNLFCDILEEAKGQGVFKDIKSWIGKNMISRRDAEIEELKAKLEETLEELNEKKSAEMAH